jgi:toxin ParE1/3/4
MAIHWTKRAVRNFESVLDYIARDNELAAVKFKDFIIDKVAVLEQHPHMGRACDVQGARELVIHENYLVVYRVRNEALEILRIRHARRKFP